MAQGSDKHVLRLFEPEDYKEYASWWDTPPPPKSLPLCGFVVGDMKFVGFLANLDMNFMLMLWWHANPKNTPRETHEALKTYIHACQAYALSLGKEHIFIYTNKRAVKRALEREGFNEKEAGHMVCGVL